MQRSAIALGLLVAALVVPVTNAWARSCRGPVVVGGAKGLYVISASGRRLRRLTRIPSRYPRWLAGDKALLFLSGRDGRYALHRLDLATRRVKRVTPADLRGANAPGKAKTCPLVGSGCHAVGTWSPSKRYRLESREGPSADYLYSHLFLYDKRTRKRRDLGLKTVEARAVWIGNVRAEGLVIGRTLYRLPSLRRVRLLGDLAL
ncbi:MAG: hypothetical protein KC503_26530 [Myxococcales bacterium]|nr:hypothetical protein [Myxococcales bacterium]